MVLIRGNQMDFEIFVSAHKKVKELHSPLISYVQGGTAIRDKLDCKYHDNDNQDNISNKSEYYCELTTQYWVWKNIKRDYYGFCHYRRFFSFRDVNYYPEDRGGNILFDEIDQSLIDKLGLSNVDDVKKYVSNNDIILTNPYDCKIDNIANLYWQYKLTKYLHSEDMDCMFTVLSEMYPEYMEAAKSCIDGSIFYPCNMYIMKKEVFDNYCTWLFNILFEMEKRIDMSEYGEEEKRALAHIAERLFCIYISYCKSNNLYKIGMVRRAFIRNTDDTISSAFPDNNIPVIFSSSDEYSMFAAATIHSVIKHSSIHNNYDLLIMDTGISDKNKQILLKVCEGHNNVSLRFIDVTYKLKKFNLSTEDHISIGSYARLLSPILFSNYSKFVYLDIDTVVLDDIAYLYNIDLKDKIIAAARDIGIIAAFRRKDPEVLKLFEQIGKTSAYDYFNAGVLVIDNDKLSALFPDTYLIEYASKHKYRYMDQDVLNGLLKDKILFLSMEWNTLHYLNGYRKELVDTHAPESAKIEYKEARKHPKIIHYAGNSKPWDNFYEDYSQEFWKTLSDTIVYEILLDRYFEKKNSRSEELNKKKEKLSLRLANKINKKYSD